MTAYPKILLLCSMSQSTANGITIANLFKGWPGNRIALAEFNDAPEAVCVSHIWNYYFLGNKEMRFIAPFHLLRKFAPSQALRKNQVEEAVGHESSTMAHDSKSGLKAWLLKLQRWYLRKTGLMLVSRRFSISPEFDSWVREFDPDIIYCVTGDLCKLEFFTRMLKHFNKQGCIHIFDDFLASKHEGTLYPAYWKRRLDVTFRSVCDQCSLHLAIGNKMAAEYTQRYGHKFYGFHNPIDPSIWLAARSLVDNSKSEQSSEIECSEEIIAKDCDSSSAIRQLSAVASANDDSPSSESVFRFLYAGKINKDTVGPIRQFMETVDRLNKAGHRISFKIHSPYPFDEIKLILGEGAEKVYGGKLPYVELPAAYRAADGLLLPLDFTEATIRYIRLSMLTKVSEYMISGTPIFCFAPKEVAVTEYLIEYEAGIHCGDPELIEQATLDFIRDEQSRIRVAANAVERARHHHLMGQVNERFRSLLAEHSE